MEGTDKPAVVPRAQIGRERLRGRARVVKSLDSSAFAKYPSLLYEGRYALASVLMGPVGSIASAD